MAVSESTNESWSWDLGEWLRWVCNYGCDGDMVSWLLVLMRQLDCVVFDGDDDDCSCCWRLKARELSQSMPSAFVVSVVVCVCMFVCVCI